MSNPINYLREQLNEMTSQVRDAFRAALSRFIGDLVITIALFILAFQSGAWQLYASAGTIAITMLLALFGAHLIRRGRVEQGAWWVILGLFPGILLSPVFVIGMGLLAGIVVVLLTVTTATQTLPPRRASWAIVASVGVGIATLLLDLFGPTTHRLAAPVAFQVVALIVAGILVLVLGIFAARQFANYSLRTKLVIGFVLTGLLTAGIIIFATNFITGQVLTDVANRVLLGEAQQTASSIDNFISSNLDNLNIEANLPEIVNYLDLPASQRAGSSQETEALAVLKVISRKANPYLLSYALLDSQGRNVLDTRAANVGIDNAGDDYFLTPFQTGDLYVSPVRVFESAGNREFYFSGPVRNADAKIIGVIRVLYDGTAIQQIMRQQNERAGPRSYAILLDENHIYLAHGTATNFIMKSATTLDSARLAELQADGRLPNRPAAELSANFPEFALALANATVQPYFTGYIGGTNSPTELEQVAITTVKSQPWQVAFVQPVDVFLEPLAVQTRRISLLAVGIIVVVAVIAFGLGQYLTQPIVRLTEVARRVIGGDLAIQASVESRDEVGRLAEAFNSMTKQLRTSIGSLEDQVRERTAELALSMEVGQRAIAIRELSELLLTITEFIRQQFNLYYTQVYIVDDLEQNLIVKAGTGSVGQQLIARHHTLPIGSDSIVGRVAAERKSILVPDTQNSNIHKANALLPETRSELAIPLLSEDRVIGVLDMQADKVNTFTEGNMIVFEAMATQLAISINSAQQWALAQEAQRKSEEAISQLTRQSWSERLASRREDLGFVYDLSTVAPFSNGDVKAGNEETEAIVPVMLQNESIGQLAVKVPSQRALSTDEQDLMAAVAQQLGQKVENLRLFEQTQQRAIREQIARQIVDKVRASRDIESALKTAAEELAKNLGVTRAMVDLHMAQVSEQIGEAVNQQTHLVETYQRNPDIK